MRDPDLFGHIDRVLHECDARRLPPLLLPPVAETAQQLGHELAEAGIAVSDVDTTALGDHLRAAAITVPADAEWAAAEPRRRRLLGLIPWGRT